MNASTPSRLPAEVHTGNHLPTSPSVPLTRISLHDPTAPGEFSKPSRRFTPLRLGLICLIMAAGLGAVLVPALRAAEHAVDGSLSSGGIGQLLGQGFLQGGLPPAGLPLDTRTTEEATMPPARETSPSDESMEEPSTDAPFEESPSENPDETCREPSPQESSPESSTAPPEVPTEPLESEGHPSDDGDTASTAPPETEAYVPEGCYPMAAVDASEAARGESYVISDGVEVPQRLPTGWLWSTNAPPTVLLVNTHPYEGYSNGEAWYDPALGGLALTDTPNAADGIVALTASLTRSLRGMGVTVIHLRIAVSAEDSTADIYDRTETMIRYYCRLYPDIGLVVNLRRSSELTKHGEILKTFGVHGGETCAQLRISVNGGRGKTTLGRDLAVALALRKGLWEQEPTLSRPVWVRDREGLAADCTDACVLTLEMGAAGNTYAEALRLLEPLATAMGELVLDEK